MITIEECIFLIWFVYAAMLLSYLIFNVIEFLIDKIKDK